MGSGAVIMMIAVLSTVAVRAWLAWARKPLQAYAALGSMSAQWLAEHRAAHS
jgi:hypothetical protein